MIHIAKNIFISEADIEEAFSRSGGPGGQNVNKVETAVQLRFNVRNCALPEDVKARLRRLCGNRVTSEGILIISSREERSRELNRVTAMEKLVSLIKKATIKPVKRIKTRPTKASKQKRVEGKKARSKTKSLRGKISKYE